MEQLTKEEAMDIFVSSAWNSWSYEYIAWFQLHQDRLCVPWVLFKQAIEDQLGRGVWTHEFAQPENLIAELEGVIPAPSMEQILQQARDLTGGNVVIVNPGDIKPEL